MRERIRREGCSGHLWSLHSFLESLQVLLSAGFYSLLVCIAYALGTATFSSELELELAKTQQQAFNNLVLAVAGNDAVAVQIEGLFEHIMMDWLGNVQQLMLASESVANSGERATLATCQGVSVVVVDIWGYSVVKQAAQQQSTGGAARQVECGSDWVTESFNG
eukprot:1667346-Rhodomonas_salina.1